MINDNKPAPDNLAAVDAWLRLRPSSKHAAAHVVLLGFDPYEFIDAINEECDLEVLYDVQLLLPLQKTRTERGAEVNLIGREVVARRIAALEADREKA